MEEYILVIGSINYDIFLKQDRLATLGETYTASDVSYAGGGKGANQAVQCAKLGSKTYMVGKVGKDNNGGFMMNELNSYGVDTKYVTRSDESTGLGVINVLEDGKVYATIVTGANYDFDCSYIDELKQVIINSKIIILQLEIPPKVVEYIIDVAYKNNIYTILNAAPAKVVSKEILKKVSCLIVNESEASFYADCVINNISSAKENYKKILSLTQGEVIITLGEHGSLFCCDDKHIEIKATKPERVLETTGAGDSYIGAFAHYKLKGKTSQESCLFASKVSSRTVMNFGGMTSMPFSNEIV